MTVDDLDDLSFDEKNPSAQIIALHVIINRDANLFYTNQRPNH